MYLWAQCSWICIVLLGTYYVVITEEIRAINWPKVLLIGFIAGSVIVLPLKGILDTPTVARKLSAISITMPQQNHANAQKDAPMDCRDTVPAGEGRG